MFPVIHTPTRSIWTDSDKMGEPIQDFHQEKEVESMKNALSLFLKFLLGRYDRASQDCHQILSLPRPLISFVFEAIISGTHVRAIHASS